MSQNRSKLGIILPSEIEEMSRRQILKTGVSMTAFASLSQLLYPGLAKAQSQGSFSVQKNLIWISMGGGWDILEVTDPKPASTSGIDMIYNWAQAQQVANSTDGARIGRWLPNIAAMGQDLLVVRGLAMGTTSHMAGNVYMDTGILSNSGNVNSASIPAIVASESAATIPIIQLDGGDDPQTDRGVSNVSVVRANNLDLYRSMYPSEDALQRKMAVLDYLKTSIANVQNIVGENDRLSALASAEDKVRGQFANNVGAKLGITSEELAAFTSGAPAGANVGRAEPFALAAKLINNDICNCINLGVGGFDTHQNQSARLQPTLEGFDFLLGQLVQTLRDGGKLDDTLIVVYSDFGRTPKINNSNGRDHWPTGGALMIGAGLDGGRAVGATDDSLNGVDLVDPNTGLQTTDSGVGIQLNPTHLGGAVINLCLGQQYEQFRSYLTPIPSMIRTRS
jgi:uncharacterized protein (DUF1501 family)